MIDSQLYSLSDIAAKNPQWHFNVPIYQRLFVWGEDQILTLLNDLINAYEKGETLYFLGSALLVEETGNEGNNYDLIDGQQRFTTLWMLCTQWRRRLTQFAVVSQGQSKKPRLRFAIRPEVNKLLEKLAFDEALDNEFFTESTHRMRSALELIDSVFAKRTLPASEGTRENYLKGLTDFVFHNVKLVITRVPHSTDLNKLFEVINNRGIQLKHHEILKARMLDPLPEMERDTYAILWEACADMGNFVERNLARLSKLSAAEVAAAYEQNKLSDASEIRKLLDNRRSYHGDHYSLSLEDILTFDTQLPETERYTIDDSDEPTDIRSIIGFPLFLQHVLRIWLWENGCTDLPRLLDKKLLEFFETRFFKNGERRKEDIRAFIDLLWRMRVIFDEQIIKWVDQGEEEIHLISAISVSKSGGARYMSRAREIDADRAFSMLQSMLYHSQEITTQYWLTPLLFYMYRNPSNPGHYFDYLRHLDTHLLGSTADKPLVERTWDFMHNPWRRNTLIHKEELSMQRGLRFPHYWFYKLEFVLWYQQKRSNPLWRDFRLTAKGSVEHISPRTPSHRDYNKVVRALDCFGNLALVSRSLNSEYGNMPYNEKRQRFINNSRNRLDSLKMSLIYENEHWNDTTAFEHQKEMIGCLDVYSNPLKGR